MRKRTINKKEIERKTTLFVRKIGQRFYDLRMTRKESIRTVAKNLKMARVIISQIEKGQYKNFKLLRFLRICEYYRVNPVDILKINLSDETINLSEK